MVEEFEGVELFGGMLTEGIWLRLIIEDVILDQRCCWSELTAQDIASETLDRGNVSSEISPGYLLKACDDYLQLYNDPFADVGRFPQDIKFMNESSKKALCKTVTAKSKLFRVRADELDAYAKVILRDGVVNPKKN